MPFVTNAKQALEREWISGRHQYPAIKLTELYDGSNIGTEFITRRFEYP